MELNFSFIINSGFNGQNMWTNESGSNVATLSGTHCMYCMHCYDLKD